MQTLLKERFMFFKTHYNDAKRQFAFFRIRMNTVLNEQQQWMKECRPLLVDPLGSSILDEMTRDGKIFLTRFERVDAKLTEVGKMVHLASTAVIARSEDSAATLDRALEQFFRWREIHSDLTKSLREATEKWYKCRKELALM